MTYFFNSYVLKSTMYFFTFSSYNVYYLFYFTATTSLLASAMTVLRSCLAVMLLYGLCYAGLRVRYRI